jgi:hypothetical protein
LTFDQAGDDLVQDIFLEVARPAQASMILKVFQARLETLAPGGTTIKHVAFINLDADELLFEAGQSYPNVVSGFPVKSVFVGWVEQVVKDVFAILGNPT